MEEFLDIDAIMLEFAHNEWERPWLLPQYRPLLKDILHLHDCTVRGSYDEFSELIERERAKLALDKPPEQPKLAAARKSSPTKRSKSAED